MIKIFKPLITITLITFTLSFVLIKDSEEIWTEQTKVKEAIDFEKSLIDEVEFIEMNVSLSESIYPLVDQYDLAKPIIVKRDLKGFLPLYTEYFYSKPDSIIRFISYDWERDKYGNYYDKPKMWEEEAKKLKQYNIEYERIKSILINKIGKPTSQDSKPERGTSYGREYLSRNTIWETKEYHSELNMIFESSTYRIRWNYYWKK